MENKEEKIKLRPNIMDINTGDIMAAEGTTTATVKLMAKYAYNDDGSPMTEQEAIAYFCALPWVETMQIAADFLGALSRSLTVRR